MAERKKRKIVLPPTHVTPTIEHKDVLILPSVEGLLEDALSIIGIELARIKYKSSRCTTPLEASEARVLQGYVKNIVELSREAREHGKNSDEEMTDAELLNHFLGTMSKDELVQTLQKHIREKSQQEEKE